MPRDNDWQSRRFNGEGALTNANGAERKTAEALQRKQSKRATKDHDLIGNRGAHCSTCRQFDFLPARCGGCKATFCGECVTPGEGHECAATKAADRKQLWCDSCDKPVRCLPTDDPSAQMAKHLASGGCGNAAKKPSCCYKGCKQKLLGLELRCGDCGDIVCATHRFPSDHACQGKAKRGAGGGGAAKRPTPPNPRAGAAAARAKPARKPASATGAAAAARAEAAAAAAVAAPVAAPAAAPDVQFLMEMCACTIHVAQNALEATQGNAQLAADLLLSNPLPLQSQEVGA